MLRFLGTEFIYFPKKRVRAHISRKDALEKQHVREAGTLEKQGEISYILQDIPAGFFSEGYLTHTKIQRLRYNTKTDV
jgi:hypothetical protein